MRPRDTFSFNYFQVKGISDVCKSVYKAPYFNKNDIYIYIYAPKSKRMLLAYNACEFLSPQVHSSLQEFPLFFKEIKSLSVCVYILYCIIYVCVYICVYIYHNFYLAWEG